MESNTGPMMNNTGQSVKPKFWGDLRQAVRELRRNFAGLSSRVPSTFSFRQLTPTKIRLYFLSSPANGRESTLFYSDVSLDVVRDQVMLPVLPWNLVIDSGFLSVPSYGKFSKEEQLQWERKRLVTTGITSYEMHPMSGKISFPAASSLFQCNDPGGQQGGVLLPVEVKTSNGSARLNCQMCPHDPDLVAFVSQGDVWACHVPSGTEIRLTWVHRSSNNLASDPLSAGMPSYVIQEEFNRYHGFWWQPVTSDGVYRILYEEVNESDVDIIKLSSMGGEASSVEEYRFPRAGTPNAKSDLKLISFRIDELGRFNEIKQLEFSQPLYNMYPWSEYLVRAGWTPEGESVWIQLVDRKQQRLEMILVPLDSFAFVNTKSNAIESVLCTRENCRTQVPMQTVCTVQSQTWVNVHDLLHFFPGNTSSTFRFIYSTEETGYRHLYLYTVQLVQATRRDVNNHAAEVNDHSSSRAVLLDKRPLTHGAWEVLNQCLYVDQQRSLVYFMGLKDTPLASHLYVTSYAIPDAPVVRLTLDGYSHTVAMNKECTIFVSVYSNTQSMAACQVFALSGGLSEALPVAFLLEPSLPDPWYQPPELFSHIISSGDTIYGMLFRPHNFREGKRYPTVLNIYGGPEVQLVTNSFKGMRQLRLHMLAALGYCVVVIDSRGSHNRGVKFESHIRGKMGTVELQDQVEVLVQLAETTGCIDMNRVAIHGWSYGGYLSLMGLAQYPNIFKLAIAGAPVTSWNLYDTGYTERYMDLPSSNPQGYRAGSVLSYVSHLPDEENRLLIIHGLIDENVHFAHTSQLVNAIVKAGKPYQLQVYPNERHSLRHLDASEHYETTLLNFLHNYL